MALFLAMASRSGPQWDEQSALLDELVEAGFIVLGDPGGESRPNFEWVDAWTIRVAGR